MSHSYSEKAQKVMRSYERLLNLKPGHSTATKEQVWDAYEDFFQDAYHLKDWIVNDDTLKIGEAKVDAFIDANEDMKLLQTVATTSKHLKADRKHITFKDIVMAWDDGTLRGSPELGYEERGFLLTEDGGYLLQENGEKIDLESEPKNVHPWTLTLKVLALWNQFFKDNGLVGGFKIVDDHRAD